MNTCIPILKRDLCASVIITHYKLNNHTRVIFKWYFLRTHMFTMHDENKAAIQSSFYLFQRLMLVREWVVLCY